jgi:ABC-type antimicrobial peptide transport system permease subunit
MGLIIDVIIVMTMSLCFFALSANMSANLYDQTKEIAVLRSIGYSKNRIRLLYFYEAILLIMASSILGVIIGCVTGYTIVMQQTTELNLNPLPFMFPW